MIITRLSGGLGNQMFQYAMGRRLAIRHKTDLKLDIRFYQDPDFRKSCIPRALSIVALNIQGSFAKPDEIDAVRQFGSQATFAQRIRRRLPILLGATTSRKFSKETTWDFDRKCLRLPDNVYLRGFWQSEEYFVDIEDTIRKDFTWKERPGAKNRVMLEKIVGCEAVSVHVRRGDYIHDSNTKAVHGVCPIEYYQTAVEILRGRVNNPHFFVFSDDPEWTRQNLRLSSPATYVNHNGEHKDYEDLRLMSQCKHHIIANSSFSWWGAWLAADPNKMVIAPRRWFVQDWRGLNGRFPPGWITL